MYRIVIDGKVRWMGDSPREGAALFSVLRLRAIDEAILYRPHDKINSITGKREVIAHIYSHR